MKKNNQLVFFKRYDILVYASIIILCILAFIIIGRVYGKNDGEKELYVYSDGELVQVMPLSEDAVYTVNYQGEYNSVVVKSGYAYIEEASCPDHVCLKSGKISRLGESTICLPNKLKIEIKGSARPQGDV